MTSDRQLHQNILDALKWEPSIRDEEIGIAVKDGVVTLSGFVDSYAEKYTAERIVEKMSGVKAIAEELKVKLPDGAARSDTEIAHALLDALEWSSQVPREKVKAKVVGGWVTLEGEVEWAFQRNAAERAVRYLAGVRGVTNQIAIRPKQVSTFEVGEKIKAALRRDAELDAERITVEAKDGVVTLRGSVRALFERRDAERAAWGAPGVTDVKDYIAVTS
jgi:osmotically-inducible protein OsmY